MTTAQQIAAQLGDDGTHFETSDGRRLESLAEAAGGVRETCGAMTRWAFPDESALTVSGAGWDIGFPNCWCWAGAPADRHAEHV